MGFYSDIEKKWYNFVADLDKGGIPIRSITDPIETAGLPSLPVVVGIMLVLMALLAFTLIPAPGATLTVTVTSNGQVLEAAQIAAIFGDTEHSVSTNEDGIAEMRLPLDEEIELLIEADDCNEKTEYLTLEDHYDLEISLFCGVSPSFAGGQCITAAQSIDTATLTTSDSGYPRSCTVTVKNSDLTPADLGWVISGKKLFLTYDDENCPQEGQRVEINCQGYEYSAPMERFVQDIQEDFEVELATDEPDTYSTTSTADSVYSATVTVTGDAGALTGARVTAVDSTGNPLTSGYSNILLQGTSGSDGIVTLVLPTNMVYYVKAEDTGTSYASKISSSYIANEDKKITLRLQKGFETIVTVLNSADNSPVKNAYVDVMKNGVQTYYGYTDNNGQAKFKLDKEDYEAKIFSTNYMPTTQAFTGGTTNTQVLLDALDDSNSGYLEVLVSNAHGVGEPLDDIKVVLMEGNDEIKHAFSNSEGIAAFGRLLTGSYTITSTTEGSDTVTATVAAGDTTTSDLTVVPPQITLDVITLVDGEPEKGVTIEVFDITYSRRRPEPIGAYESGINRKTSFSYDKESVVYLKGTFFDDITGEQYGPVLSQPITLDNDTELTLDVTGVQNNVEIQFLTEDKQPLPAGYEFQEGGNYYIEFNFGLPYFDPQTKEKYISAHFELFTGGIGDLDDLRSTPVIIREYAEQDFTFINGPTVSGLTNADSYYTTDSFISYTGAPNGATKYIRIDISDYIEAGDYVAHIPIHVRSNVLAENAMFNYRGSWESPEGNIFTTGGNNKWTEISIPIADGTEGWRFIEDNPYFYLYDAWLSYDRSGELEASTWEDNPTSDNAPEIAEGSNFYLQIRAKAKTTLPSYYVDLLVDPTENFPYAIPESYSGKILRTSGKIQEIYPVYTITDLTKLSPPTDAKGSDYSLDADDEIQLAIRMKARLDSGDPLDRPRPTTLTVLNDRDRPDLHLKIRNLKPSEETPVSNVVATEVVGSLIEGVPRIYNHATEVVPSYTVPEYGKTYGKVFGGLIHFENTGTDKNLKFVIQDEHRTKGNEQPWAKFYEMAIPVYIDDSVAEVAYTSEKQVFVWGLAAIDDCESTTECSELNIDIEHLENGTWSDADVTGPVNIEVHDNAFVFDFVSNEVGNHRVTVGVDVDTIDNVNATRFEDALDIYIADLPEINVDASIPQTISEGEEITISTTIMNMDESSPLTILKYSSEYHSAGGDPERFDNTLEPRVAVYIDNELGGSDAIPPLSYKGNAADNPYFTDSISFKWIANSGAGPKTIKVCTGYWEHVGETTGWQVISHTEYCDEEYLTVLPTTNTSFVDLGLTLDINATEHYKTEINSVEVNATVSNQHETNDTNTGYDVDVVWWVTNEYGFPVEERSTLGIIDSIKANTTESVDNSANPLDVSDYSYGEFTVTACAVYGIPYSDTTYFANLKEGGVRVEAEDMDVNNGFDIFLKGEVMTPDTYDAITDVIRKNRDSATADYEVTLPVSQDYVIRGYKPGRVLREGPDYSIEEVHFKVDGVNVPVSGMYLSAGKHTITLINPTGNTFNSIDYFLAIPLSMDVHGEGDECASKSFTIINTPQSVFEGEENWMPDLGSGPSGGETTTTTTTTVNLRELINNKEYNEALKKVLLINRTGEPTLEKIESPDDDSSTGDPGWTLTAGSTDWTLFVGKGVLADGTPNILEEASTLEVYLFESDADTTGLEPWGLGSFEHGWIDYDISLQGVNSAGVSGAPDIYSQVLIANLIKKDALNKQGTILDRFATSDSQLLANGSAIDHLLDSKEGYSDDTNNDNLVIPYSNSKNMYVRYLPDNPVNRINAGNINVFASGPKFELNRTFTIGGLGIEPSATQDWDFTTQNIYKKTFKLTNHWTAPITLGAFNWAPNNVDNVFGLYAGIISVYDKYDYSQTVGNTITIPPGGYANMQVTGSPNTQTCGGEETAYLEIPVAGGVDSVKIQFNVTCSGDRVTLVGNQLVVRETAAPVDVHTVDKGCAIEQLEGGRTRVAVCDAEQFGMALLRDAEAGVPVAYYALGLEDFAVGTLQGTHNQYYTGSIQSVYKQGSVSSTGGKELWVINDHGASCGIVQANFTQIVGGDVNVDLSTNTAGAEWCTPGGTGGLVKVDVACDTPNAGPTTELMCIENTVPVGTKYYGNANLVTPYTERGCDLKLTTSSTDPWDAKVDFNEDGKLDINMEYVEDESTEQSDYAYNNLGTSYTYNTPGTYTIRAWAEQDGKVGACSEHTVTVTGTPLEGYAYPIGLLNYDGTLRSNKADAVDFAGFATGSGDMGKFITAIENVIDKGLVDVELNHLFSYAANVESDYEGEHSDSSYSFEYKDIHVDAAEDWMKTTNDVAGYFNVKEGSAGKGHIIQLGLVYLKGDYSNEPELLDGYRQQLAIDLIKRWTSGADDNLADNTEKVWSLTVVGKPTAVLPSETMSIDLSIVSSIDIDGTDSYDSNGQIMQYIWTLKGGARIEVEEYDTANNMKIKYVSADNAMVLNLIDTSKKGSGIYKLDIPATGKYNAELYRYWSSFGEYGTKIDSKWELWVDGSKWTPSTNEYTSSTTLSEGTHDVELRYTGTKDKYTYPDYISFVSVGDGEESTSTTGTKTYRNLLEGTYTVELKVRDNDGVESDAATMTLKVLKSSGANLMIGEATQEDGVVFDVHVPVTNSQATSAGKGVVSIWKIPIARGRPGEPCAGIPTIGSMVGATPTGEMNSGGSTTIDVQTSSTSDYIVAMVSGSGARLPTCDYEVTGAWIDYASPSFSATATGNKGANNKAVDDQYLLSEWTGCDATNDNCIVTIDLGKVVTDIKQIDTYLYDENCEVYEGYIMEVSENTGTSAHWTVVTDKSRIAGVQHDQLTTGTKLQYIRYTFKKPKEAGVQNIAKIVEVNAYTETTTSAGASGSCGTSCYDLDGDGYGVSAGYSGCAADPDDHNTCVPSTSGPGCGEYTSTEMNGWHEGFDGMSLDTNLWKAGGAAPTQKLDGMGNLVSLNTGWARTDSIQEVPENTAKTMNLEFRAALGKTENSPKIGIGTYYFFRASNCVTQYGSADALCWQSFAPKPHYSGKSQGWSGKAITNAGGWHIYKIKTTPKNMYLYIDGVLVEKDINCYDIAPAHSCSAHPNLVEQLALQTPIQIIGKGSAVKSDSIRVDWIRYWEE